MSTCTIAIRSPAWFGFAAKTVTNNHSNDFGVPGYHPQPQRVLLQIVPNRATYRAKHANSAISVTAEPISYVFSVGLLVRLPPPPPFHFLAPALRKAPTRVRGDSHR